MPVAKIKVDGKYYELGGLSASQRKVILDEAHQYAENLKKGMQEEIDGLLGAIAGTDEYIDNAFKDGIISEIEARTIKTHLRNIATKKAEMDREYLDIFGNVYIDDDNKASLTASKMHYDSTHVVLVEEIENAISDGLGTPEESALIDTRFAEYNSAIALLISALNSAIDQIGNAKDKELEGLMDENLKGTIMPINTKILAMESSITQTAEEISLKVSRDELTTVMDTVSSAAVLEASQYADGLKKLSDESISSLTGRLNETDEYIENAFKDGIITTLEASSIQTYINDLNTAKASFNITYTDLYSNIYLKGVPKSNLATAKTNLNLSHDSLISTINTAIADGVATPAESADVDAKFATYSDSVATYSLRVNQATDAISKEKALEAQGKAKDYTDGVMVPVTQKLTKHDSEITQLADEILLRVTKEEFDAGIDVANGYADGLKTALDADIQGLSGELNSTKTYIDEAFRDGIIYEAEANKIASYLLSLAESKNNMDSRYNTIYSNTSLTGTPKTNLASAKGVYDTRYNALVKAINDAITDQAVDSVENDLVNTAYVNYSNSIALLSSTLESAIDAVVSARSAKALADAKTYTDGIKTNLDGIIADLNQDISTTEDYIDNAFRDGIVTSEEAKRIKGYIAIVDESKGVYDQQYTEVYNNADLGSSYKSELGLAKTKYNTSYTNLMASINNAIADGKSTSAEASDVASKFTLYTLESKNLTSKIEKALDNIARNLANKALDDAKAIIAPLDGRMETNEAAITTLSSAIEQRVTKTVFDPVSTKVTEHEGKITTMAGQISLSVTRTEVQEEIAKIELGGRNLVIRTGELDNTWINLDGTITTANGHATSLGYIEVKTGDTLVFTKNGTASDFFRWSWHKADKTFMGRKAESSNEFLWVVPADISFIRVSYPKTVLPKVEKGNIATDWTPAPEDVDSAISKVSGDLSTVSTSLSNLNTEIKGTFKDGLITEAETLSIKKYINTINTEKGEVDSRYNTIYADVGLIGTPKTDLLGKKNSYNTAHTNLIASINTAILDGKTTAAESTDVDNKFGLYRTALSNLSVSFEIAINTIAQSKVNKLSTEVIDPLVTRISNAEIDIKADAIVSKVTSSSSWTNQTTAIGTAQGTANSANTTANDLKTNVIPAISSRLETAEQKITKDAIVSTVRSDTKYVADLNSKATPEDIEKAKSTNYGYRYYERIVIYGDSTSLYYPVIIKGGDQNVKRDILIKRGYSEQAPPDWFNSTHKGGLTVKLKTNFGGWGGANYSWEVHELEEMYSKTFAGAGNVGNQTMFAVFLRGGGTTGAVYHIYSDQPLDSTVYSPSPIPRSPQIAYNQDKIFESGTYLAYAPVARSYTQDVIDEIAIRNFIPLTKNLESRVSSAELKITKDAIVSTVRSDSKYTTDIKSAVDGIEVGGSNYASKSKIASMTMVGTTGTLNTNHPDCPYGFYSVNNQTRANIMRLSNVIDSNGYWTVSFDIKGNQSAEVSHGVSIVGSSEITLNTNKTNTWSRVTATFLVTGYDGVKNYVDFRPTWSYIFVKNIKIEKGNKATDWTPSTDDVDSTISELSNRVSTAEVAIKADSIVSTVTKSDVWVAQNTAIGTAQSTANTALTNAGTANSLVNDMASDMKVTPLEKSNLKTTWDAIKAEYTQLKANADTLGVSSTSLLSAYNGMVSTAPRIEIDVLASMNTTYTFGSTSLRDAFRAQFNTYFTQREITQKAVRDKIQSNANAAQGTANDAKGTADTLKNTTVPNLTTRVSTAESSITQHAGLISSKVSSTDFNGNTIASLINQSATTISINAAKINLVGAVSVLSDITGNLGTVTTGRIQTLQIAGTNSQVYFGTSISNFDGRIDYTDSSMRFQSDASTYLKVNKGGSSGGTTAQKHLIQMYGAGSPIFNFGIEDLATGHRSIGSGKIMLKFLNSTVEELQIRDRADNVYKTITASDFKVASKREFKDNIKPLDKSATDIVLRTPIFGYNFKGEDHIKKIGFIWEESPDEIRDLESISHMNAIGVLWKAVQERAEYITVLEKRLAKVEKKVGKSND